MILYVILHAPNGDAMAVPDCLVLPRLALMKNGQYQVTAYGGKGNYQQGSNSALLLLNQGDLVHLELQQGSLYEHPHGEAYTSFSGFIVEAY